MASAADLGISEQEFQDAVNLEKLYSLVSKANNRCANCKGSPLTHADVNGLKLLCRGCGAGKPGCKRIGDDRFKKHEIDRLEKKIGAGSSRQESRNEGLS
eukprot:GHVU01094243.1.p3 GENE.GHVU01094243.1~~GHVU01094243.1.p3  ORF type:complete len:100 (+),score=12.83 GHVU01094243.1:59-358(+)